MSILRKSKYYLSFAALSASAVFTVPTLINPAIACGGFFCNANLPVNQSAERVVFARVDGQIHMHVQIEYQGPPTSFAWLLPTSPRVETAISSEAFFSALDRIYGPKFNLEYTYDEGCYGDLDYFAEPSAEGDGNAPPPAVQVLSREAIGPYDRAILLPDTVQALRDWLDENGYQIPENLDEKLQPYVELRSAFVAIKLLPGLEAGDIVPLRLSFPGDRPSIPILPTAVAADPDMGVIVHIFDEARAVPVNYSHVTINEAAIDWVNRGSNYADVVSQAADEAGGRAFVTDFAGPVGEQLSDVLSPYSASLLSQVSQVSSLFALMELFDDRTNPDLHRVLANFIEVPEDQDPSQYFRCVQCYTEDDRPVDGAQIAEALQVEMNEVYEQINTVLSQTPYVTRLYSTLSAEEMDRDPSFSINPDLEEVSNLHTASAHVACMHEPNYSEFITITLSDGRTFQADEITPIIRQDGETVRGQDVPAAASIEQMYEAGQPEVIMERTPEQMTPDPDDSKVGGAEENTEENTEGNQASVQDTEDKGCQQQSTSTSFLSFILLMLGLVKLLKIQQPSFSNEDRS